MEQVVQNCAGNKMLFSTCQVRVVRFYVGYRPPPRPPHPPRPPPPPRSVPHRTSTASSARQCSPPDRKHYNTRSQTHDQKCNTNTQWTNTNTTTNPKTQTHNHKHNVTTNTQLQTHNHKDRSTAHNHNTQPQHTSAACLCELRSLKCHGGDFRRTVICFSYVACVAILAWRT